MKFFIGILLIIAIFLLFINLIDLLFSLIKLFICSILLIFYSIKFKSFKKANKKINGLLDNNVFK